MTALVVTIAILTDDCEHDDSVWWGGFPQEYALLDKGWVYRSEKEAQAALPSVAKELGVEYKL